jgi:CMP-N-acetylneuraminic acid synthetase
MNVVAVIPARSGSRRMPHKNITKFDGEPLLVRKILQLKRVSEISEIIVSSDSDLYLSMAVDAGAKPHKRAPAYCDEVSVPFGEVVAHVCECLPGKNILWAPCTSPLVEPATYIRAIACYATALENGYDSLISVEPFKRYVWNEEGPVNYRLGLGHVPSQELPPLYFISDGIALAPRERMIAWKYFHGTKPFKFCLPKLEAVDVDDELDFRCAEAWARLQDPFGPRP